MVDEFSLEAGLDKDLRMRLRHALQYNSENSSLASGAIADVFNELPKSLKYEVAMVMH